MFNCVFWNIKVLPLTFIIGKIGMILYLTSEVLQVAIINANNNIPPIIVKAKTFILQMVGLITQQQPRKSIIMHIIKSPLILYNSLKI